MEFLKLCLHGTSIVLNLKGNLTLIANYSEESRKLEEETAESLNEIRQEMRK